LLFGIGCCIIIIFYPRQSLFSEHTRIQHVTLVAPQPQELDTGFPASHKARFCAASNFLKMGIQYLNLSSKLAAFRRGYVTWSQDFRGKGSSLRNIFGFLQT